MILVWTIVFTVGYSIVVYVSFFRNETRLQFVSFWSAVVVLVSITALPWIEFGGTGEFDSRVQGLTVDSRLDQVLNDTSIKEWIEKAPILELALSCSDEEVEACVNLMPNGPLKEYTLLVRMNTSISGLTILTQVGQSSTMLRITILFALAWSILRFLWDGIGFVSGGEIVLPQIVGLSISVAMLITAILLLWYYPIVDTLGYRDKFSISTVNFFGAGGVGVGILWTWIGIVTMLVASIGQVFYSSSDTDSSSLVLDSPYDS